MHKEATMNYVKSREASKEMFRIEKCGQEGFKDLYYQGLQKRQKRNGRSAAKKMN